MVVLHSTHLYNGVIKSIYSDVFKNLDSYKGIIVSTVKQKFNKRDNKNKIPVYNINVGYILDEKSPFMIKISIITKLYLYLDLFQINK